MLEECKGEKQIVRGFLIASWAPATLVSHLCKEDSS